jgi:prevent-host-death family protein
MFQLDVKRAPKVGKPRVGTKVTALVLRDEDGHVVRDVAVDMAAMETQEDVLAASLDMLTDALPEGRSAEAKRYGWRFEKRGGLLEIRDAGSADLALALARRASSSDDRNHETRDIAARELRNEVSRVLRDVEQGRRIRVTVNGRAVAELVPVASRRVAVPYSELVVQLRSHRADGALLDELRRTLPDTVDDLPR